MGRQFVMRIPFIRSFACLQNLFSPILLNEYMYVVNRTVDSYKFTTLLWVSGKNWNFKVVIFVAFNSGNRSEVQFDFHYVYMYIFYEIVDHWMLMEFAIHPKIFGEKKNFELKFWLNEEKNECTKNLPEWIA